MLFFLLIDVKMPTIVGILTLMSRKKSCSAELSMKIYYNLGACIGQVYPSSYVEHVRFVRIPYVIISCFKHGGYI